MNDQRISSAHLCILTVGLLLAGAFAMAQSVAASDAQKQDEDSAHQLAFHGRYEQTAFQYGEHRDYDSNDESMKIAQQTGFQDGVSDGRRDRESGRGSRPTEDRNYRSADRGYSAGDRDRFRQLYRESYTRGYQEGYNGRVEGRDDRDRDRDRDER